MASKKFIFTVLLLAVVIPTNRAHALLGIGDINLESVPVIGDIIQSDIAKSIAQKMIDQIVKETVEWANSGFEDNPAYATDVGGFLKETADAAAGEFINGTDLSFLCSPFEQNIRLSLRYKYLDSSGIGLNKPYACTLSGIKGNIEDFYHGSFNRGGGWDTWFAVTQNPSNNPYGALVEAQIELDRRLTEKIGVEEKQLNWNGGYLSWAECTTYNPPAKIPSTTQVGSNAPITVMIPNPKHVAGKNEGECIKRGPVQTPGTAIKGVLEDHALTSGISKLIDVEDLDDLVSAFASGLIKRYVAGDHGLFNTNTGQSASRELLDVDGDQIPDGWNIEVDGRGRPTGNLDICAHGLKNEDEAPSNENCILSREAGSSPFFVPICEDIQHAIVELYRYFDFISGADFDQVRNLSGWTDRSDRNLNIIQGYWSADSMFDPVLSTVWINQSNSVSNAVGDLISSFNRYGVASAYRDALWNVGWYENWLDDKIIGSLVKNKDIQDTGTDNDETQLKLIYQTGALLDYLLRYQENIGRCDAPNTDALQNVAAPAYIEDNEDVGNNEDATATSTDDSL